MPTRCANAAWLSPSCRRCSCTRVPNGLAAMVASPFRVPPPPAFDGRWSRRGQGLSTIVATHRNIDVPGRTCTGELLGPRGAVLRFEVVSEVADALHAIQVVHGDPPFAPRSKRKAAML